MGNAASAQDPDLQALGVRRRRVRWTRVLVGVAIVAAVTLILGFYVPIVRTHSGLVAEYKKLSAEKQELDKSLSATAATLKKAERRIEELETKQREAATEADAQKQSLSEVKGKLMSKLAEQRKEGSAAVKASDTRVYVTLADRLVFKSRTLKPSEKGTDLLCTVASASGSNQLEVAGSAVEEEQLSLALRRKYGNPWAMSAARAASVVDLLETKCKVAPERLSAAGLGNGQAAKRESGGVEPPGIRVAVIPRP